MTSWVTGQCPITEPHKPGTLLLILYILGSSCSQRNLAQGIPAWITRGKLRVNWISHLHNILMLDLNPGLSGLEMLPLFPTAWKHWLKGLVMLSFLFPNSAPTGDSCFGYVLAVFFKMNGELEALTLPSHNSAKSSMFDAMCLHPI